MIVANIGDVSGKVYPAVVEATPDSYILYGQDGVNRRILLRCSRGERGIFVIEDGEFASDIIGLSS